MTVPTVMVTDSRPSGPIESTGSSTPPLSQSDGFQHTLSRTTDPDISNLTGYNSSPEETSSAEDTPSTLSLVGGKGKSSLLELESSEETTSVRIVSTSRENISNFTPSAEADAANQSNNEVITLVDTSAESGETVSLHSAIFSKTSEVIAASETVLSRSLPVPSSTGV